MAHRDTDAEKGQDAQDGESVQPVEDDSPISEAGSDLEGVVKWYSIAKGYGFLSFEDKDVFIHHSLVTDDPRLLEGEPVRFQMVDSPKGLQATKIVRFTLGAVDGEEAS